MFRKMNQRCLPKKMLVLNEEANFFFDMQILVLSCCLVSILTSLDNVSVSVGAVSTAALPQSLFSPPSPSSHLLTFEGFPFSIFRSNCCFLVNSPKSVSVGLSSIGINPALGYEIILQQTAILTPPPPPPLNFLFGLSQKNESRHWHCCVFFIITVLLHQMKTREAVAENQTATAES